MTSLRIWPIMKLVFSFKTYAVSQAQNREKGLFNVQ